MPSLCELSDVKEWLTIPATEVSEDPLLERLIGATSDDFLNCVNRADLIPARNYTEYRQGNGSQEIFLLHYPMNYVSSVSVDGTDIPASPDGIQSGYWFDPSNDPENAIKLTLLGFQFTDWRNWLQRAFPGWTSTSSDLQNNNVIIEYNAGYAIDNVTDEAQAVPTVSTYTVRVDQSRHFGTDKGVKYSAGGVFVKVSGSPGVGQYAVDSAGIYTFSAADQGQAVLISYLVSGVPPAIEQAVIDWVAFRYKGRQWIGQSSRRTAAGDATTFNNVLMPASTAAVCQKYDRLQF